MKQTFIFFLLLQGTFGFGQSVTVNYDIDTAVFKVAEPLELWLNFLATKDDAKGAVYWNQAEVDKYGIDSYCLIENELQFGVDNHLLLLSYANIKVLSIRKVEEYYKITSLMEFAPKEGKSNVQYIFHVYAAEEEGQLKLFNALAINTQLHLSTTTVGFIHFHYPKAHAFDQELAQKQNDFLLEVCRDFDVKADTIDYYFAPTYEEIQCIKGFDFIIGDNGEQIPAGKADSQNRIVYSSGLGEYFPHEFIHILLNPKFPNCHLWFNEGLATYLGMSRGKDLDWHLHKVHQHLATHPAIDLNNMLELRSLDQYTDYRYALGGFLIREAYKKGGYSLVKQLLNAGKEDTDFYAAIEKNLGVKQVDLNEWIRTTLSSNYSKDE